MLISLSTGVLEVFRRHAQLKPGDVEAGGVLLGRARGPHLEVIEATEPTCWDQRMPFFFQRSARPHRRVAEARWVHSGGEVGYIGEWHTHPENHPTPSPTDVREWTVLAAQRGAGSTLLSAIVGRQSLYLELIGHVGVRRPLEPVS
jgi:integrative and conjugative element protein (TIGR02256 family)